MKSSYRILVAAILLPFWIVFVFFAARLGQATADHIWQTALPAMEQYPFWIMAMAGLGVTVPFMLLMVVFTPSRKSRPADAAEPG